MQLPSFDIDPAAFARDPYPVLARMRATAPVAYVPQLGAVLITRRNTIAACERRVDVFSSVQPGGLMTRLMGQNMMRKDGDAHTSERKAAFPAFSPRTVRDVWVARFVAETRLCLDALENRAAVDLVRDFAMPVSGHALRHVTGLTNLAAADMDQVSQAMIDGISNYANDPEPEARCRAATARIDEAIAARLTAGPEPHSLLSALVQAGQPMESVQANIRLAISGGQNESRDVIAGATWAVMERPEVRRALKEDRLDWGAVFDEFCRWISPIGMSPREVVADVEADGVTIPAGSRAFLMFGSGNRDDTAFDDPDVFDPRRAVTGSLAFGAGPHFCAGAAAARSLVADVALPMLFERFPDLALDGPVEFAGWAFRGPLAVPVKLGRARGK